MYTLRQNAQLSQNIKTTFLIGLLIASGLFIISRYNYLFFHSLAELFCMVVACCVFTMTWHLRHIIDAPYLIFIGVSYLYIAVFDSLHLLTYSGMNLLEHTSTNVSTQLWIAGRGLEAMALLLASFVKPKHVYRIGYLSAIFIILTVILLATIFYWEVFPLCYSEPGGLTMFKKGAEYIIITILLVALIVLQKQHQDLSTDVIHLVSTAIILTIFSEVFFTLYHTPQGITNQIGHSLKIISYYFIFRALIVTGIETPFNLLFTKSKQNEEDLKSREELLRQALDNYPDPFVIYDHNRCIEYINSKGVALTGKTRAYLIGKTDETIFPAKFAQASVTLLNSLFKGVEACSQEIRLELPPKRVTFILRYVPVLDKDLKISRVLGITQDISRQKDIENEISRARDQLEMRVKERTNELMAANENLKEFVYIASHDLQAPLRKIAYFGERLQYLFKSELNEKGREFLSHLLTSIERVRRLVDSLLEYSRASSKNITFTEVDLNAIVHEVVEDLEPYIKDINGQISWENLPVITADDIQMKQLFQNLISNGLKFNAQPDKRVHIHAAPVHYHNSAERSGPPKQTIYVEDNGIGIDSQYMDDIFSPFQRLHSERLYEGAGIGLSICKKIVERHGGTITADNRKNQGAVFTVSLPESSTNHFQTR